MTTPYFKLFAAMASLLLCITLAVAQPVTGVWRGKVTRGGALGRQAYKLELKLVKNGDSLTGTSYYYASANNYYRYSVKGYFSLVDNSINWWDDQLIESHTAGISLGSANNQPLLTNADFNCPGGDVMKLDGNTHPKNGGNNYEIHLVKYQHPDFKDEWDPVIEDYFMGGADPYIIDSVSRIAFTKPVPPTPPETPAPKTTPRPSVPESTVFIPAPPSPKPAPETTDVVKQNPPATPPTAPLPQQPPVITPPQPVITKAPPTIEEKFAQRKTAIAATIPVSGDSMEFKFYDNAEVDGDSISIFLNGKLLYTHIRLTDKGYSLKIPATLLGPENNLVMVAENLGSIPPNTAYMEAWSGGKRYAARLESTEGSSAMIKLKRE